MDNLLVEIKQILDKRQAEDIVILDFRKSSPFIDYFMIGTVRNFRMAKAIIEELEDFADEHNLKIISVDKRSDSKWLLIDLNQVVVHIFYDGEREKYNLEGLWKDLEVLKM